jgi:hypothetical protein
VRKFGVIERLVHEPLLKIERGPDRLPSGLRGSSIDTWAG